MINDRFIRTVLQMGAMHSHPKYRFQIDDFTNAQRTELCTVSGRLRSGSEIITVKSRTSKQYRHVEFWEFENALKMSKSPSS